MVNFLKKLQNQPVEIRKKIMYGGVSICAVFVFLSWLFLFPHQPKEHNEDKDNNSLSFSKIKDGLKEKMTNSGINNITGELKNATEDLGKEKIVEIKISEVPRLPLEID